MEQAAEIAAEEGIARVTKSNTEFIGFGIREIAKLDTGTPVTGETFRLMLSTYPALPEPSHPNAWGALIRHALRLGLLTPTGAWRRTRDVPSHGRPTQVYVRTAH